MQIRHVILSRGRYETICTHKILNRFDLVVPATETQAYKEVVDNYENIISIPDEITGLGSVRNWVLDYYSDEIVVMYDDDVSHFFSLLNDKAYKITDRDMIECIIGNAAINCMDANLSMFGLNQVQSDVRKYDHTQPFNLKGWGGTIVGIIGRKYRFTEINKTKVDADYSLQCLLRDRIVWIDNRFSFACKRDHNKGGNSLYRSQDRINKEIAFLENKWGSHIKISNHNHTYSLKLNVQRTQRTFL